VHRRSYLDPGEDVATDGSAVGELCDADAAWEELSSTRPQRRERPTVTQELEPQSVGTEPLRHIAAIDEEQFEHASRSRAADGDRASVEASHDRASDVEDDDDPDP
jgi:hypothetical protein